MAVFMNMLRTLTVDPDMSLSTSTVSPSTSHSSLRPETSNSNSNATRGPSRTLSDPQPSARMLGKYILGETLGVGGFSKVKLGIDPSTEQKFAIKIMMSKSQTGRLSEKHRRALMRELHAMRSIEHEHVIRLFDWNEDGEYPNADGSYSRCVYTVLELATGGELFDFLMFTGHFDEVTCRSYFDQLCRGMKACHDAGISHRDIKPENLLLDANFNLKIADFGFAKQFRRGDIDYLMTTACGTRGYLSPELLRGDSYGPKCDIFACGIILFTLYAGFPPFQHAIATDWWWNKLETKNYRLFWMAHERTRTFNDDLKDICVNILASDPEERFGFDEIMSHEWYVKRKLSSEELSNHLRQARRDMNRQRAARARREQRDDRNNAPANSSTQTVRMTLPEGVPQSQLRYERMAESMGPSFLFENATDNWADAPFIGSYHAFVSNEDARATFTRLKCVSESMGFTTSVGGGAKILMIRCGIGSDFGAMSNVLIAVKLFRVVIDGRARHQVMFKRFMGDPAKYHLAVDALLSHVDVLAIIDTTVDIVDDAQLADNVH